MRFRINPAVISLLCVGLLLACQRDHQQRATTERLQPQPARQPAAENPAVPPNLPQEFIKAFRGTISNDLPVVALLKHKGNDLSGAYIYEKRADNLELSGTLDPQGNLRLEENAMTKDGRSLTGVFTGKFTSEQAVEGTWAKAQGGDPVPFHLTEVDTAAPGRFEGHWLWTMTHSANSFDMTLKQRGNKLSGTYDAFQRSPDGEHVSKIDAQSEITGTVEGSVARVNFVSGFAGDKGQAVLIQTGDFLLWCDTTTGQIESYDPRAGILRRTAK